MTDPFEWDDKDKGGKTPKEGGAAPSAKDAKREIDKVR